MDKVLIKNTRLKKIFMKTMSKDTAKMQKLCVRKKGDGKYKELIKNTEKGERNHERKPTKKKS